jgi:hypothetical protein
MIHSTDFLCSFSRHGILYHPHFLFHATLLSWFVLYVYKTLLYRYLQSLNIRLFSGSRPRLVLGQPNSRMILPVFLVDFQHGPTKALSTMDHPVLTSSDISGTFFWTRYSIWIDSIYLLLDHLLLCIQRGSTLDGASHVFTLHWERYVLCLLFIWRLLLISKFDCEGTLYFNPCFRSIQPWIIDSLYSPLITPYCGCFVFIYVFEDNKIKSIRNLLYILK